MASLKPLLAPIGIMVSALLSFPLAAADIKSEKSRFRVAPPAGFEQLEADRELVVDVYYGGRKRGTARVAIFAEKIEFLDPTLVATFVDDAAVGLDLVRMLAEPFDAHRAQACGRSPTLSCGHLDAKSIGVILDEDRFRVDLFVAANLRSAAVSDSLVFLDRPSSRPSAITRFGLNLAGGSQSKIHYGLQNRSILAWGPNRLRSDLSLQRGRGIVSDNIVAESDVRSLRFSGGQFWTPATGLISRRKMLGAGVSSQFDTRMSKQALYGTPVEVFLNASGRVDVWLAGQLISSQILGAGNRQLDTSRWPGGSYEVLLRIQEPGRPLREERVFFARDESLAPIGHAEFHFFGGLQAGPSGFADRQAFVQTGGAIRLSRHAGLRGTAILTGHKLLADVTGTAVLDRVTLSAGALASTAGDAGVALRGYSTAIPGLSASFDLRKIWARRDRPILPQSSGGTSYEDLDLTQYERGSFLQLSGQLSARLRNATLRLSGYLRRSEGDPKSYSLGPSVDWPVVRTERFSFVLEADARKSEAGFQSYSGIRLLLHRGSRSLGFRGGIEDDSYGAPVVRGEIQGAMQGGNENIAWSSNVAAGKNETGAYSRAGGEVRSAEMNGRGEFLHQFGNGTSFAAAFETGVIATQGSIAVAGRVPKEAALIVSANGAKDEHLEVFIDGSAVGSASPGNPLAVYVEPYRAYSVKARGKGEALVHTDLSDREVTVFPGSVAQMTWDFSRIAVIYGRLLDSRGLPLSNAQIRGPHGVAESDAEGFFQVEAKGGDSFEVGGVPRPCAFRAPSFSSTRSILKVGDIQCD